MRKGMLKMDKYYKINSKDISYKIIDSEAVILNLKKGDYYSLTKTATFIWNLLEKKISQDDIINSLAEEFGIDKRIANKDIKALLRDLISEKLIVEDE